MVYTVTGRPIRGSRKAPSAAQTEAWADHGHDPRNRRTRREHRPGRGLGPARARHRLRDRRRPRRRRSVATPAADPWTSPLWGRPDTVGGYWPCPTPPSGSSSRRPVPDRTGRQRRVAQGFVAAVRDRHRGDADRIRRRQGDPARRRRRRLAADLLRTGGRAERPGAERPRPERPNQGLLPWQDPQTQPSQGSGSTGSSSATADPAVVAAVAPSIVNITTTVGYDGGQAAGTGEVMTEDGYVLTNHHVIAGSTSIKVTVIGTARPTTRRSSATTPRTTSPSSSCATPRA